MLVVADAAAVVVVAARDMVAVRGVVVAMRVAARAVRGVRAMCWADVAARDVTDVRGVVAARDVTVVVRRGVVAVRDIVVASERVVADVAATVGVVRGLLDASRTAAFAMPMHASHAPIKSEIFLILFGIMISKMCAVGNGYLMNRAKKNRRGGF